ncbi:flagellar filament capping protein FliD [Paenibacillus xanthanilyticus]|uniref:Flagellar hook-associated protein 2 n=1 Tax=Paenibacillus xanthanilyticus TaxID=1783531 RepID=A0ABV8K7K2_9BACL
MVGVNRLSGLVSGLDTDSLVKALVSSNSAKVNKYKQKQDMLEWKRTDYREMNSKILDFRNSAFNMKLQSSYMTKTVTSSQDSAVSVSASTSANTGQFNIEVSSLASGASLTSAVLGSNPDFTNKNLTINDFNGNPVDILSASGSNTKPADLVNLINAKSSETGVKASYDSTMQRIFFTTTKTGENAEITLGGSAVSVLNTVNKVGAASTSEKGTNADVTFNGVSGSYETNTFSIAGLNITAKAVTTTPATVTVNQDSDAIFNTIKGFVDKYNELIETVNKKISETHERSFEPLTKEQKDAMSEDEIKKWEEKAKAGLLSRDSILTSGLSSLRQAFSEKIDGMPVDLDSLAKIGISSTLSAGGGIAGSYMDKGKIYISDSKLKQAIADNPDEVMKLFTANDGDDKASGGDGLAVRLYDRANEIINKITAKAGSTGSVSMTSYSMGKELLELKNRISTEETRISDLQERYYRQFSRMESYLSKMNSQSSWMAGQTGQ